MTHQILDDAIVIFDWMPRSVRKLAFVAGGCFRSTYDGTRPKDYDLFFRSHADWQEAVNAFRSDERFVELTKPGEDMYPSFTGDVAAPFNLIGFRFHDDIVSLANSFDFRCCGFAAEADDYEVSTYAVPGAVADATARVLNFLNHQHIDRVIRRMDRYVNQYGYRRSEQFEDGLIICRGMPVDSSAGNY